MSKKQTGFNAAIIIPIAIVIALTGIGVYVWQAQKNKPTTSSTTTDTSQAPTSQPEMQTAETQLTEYLEIKEWGIKVKLRDAAKVTYTYSDKGGDEHYIGHYDSSVTPVMKPEFLKDKSCTVGIAMFRSTTKIENFTQEKIGDYYYWATGGPGACSDDPQHNPDDQLKQRILQDFSPKNAQQL